MASKASNETRRMTLSHLDRTAAEPRDPSLHTVNLTQIDQFNSRIRLLRLSSSHPNDHVTFLPGQWLDVHVPGVEKPGGFTITSPPPLEPSLEHPLESPPTPYIELAIQDSPQNPPAAWLWRPEKEILGSELQVRVGGSFVWPPPQLSQAIPLQRVVFVAGGVGINPLMSMLSHLTNQWATKKVPFEVKFLYSLRDPGDGRSGDSILFLERLVKCFNLLEKSDALQLFLTGSTNEKGVVDCNENEVGFLGRRIEKRDILEALGPVKDRKGTVVYICGVPDMTDEFVDAAKQTEGMSEKHVMCEKWW